MKAKELVLNIAVNLGRIARWADEGKTSRISAFLIETEGYMKELEQAEKSAKFNKTFESFRITFEDLKNKSRYDPAWAEEVLTWANILQHRAKLA